MTKVIAARNPIRPERPCSFNDATWFWPNERRVSTLVTELHLGVFAQHLDGA